jgi:hypothetical protein
MKWGADMARRSVRSRVVRGEVLRSAMTVSSPLVTCLLRLARKPLLPLLGLDPICTSRTTGKGEGGGGFSEPHMSRVVY